MYKLTFLAFLISLNCNIFILVTAVGEELADWKTSSHVLDQQFMNNVIYSRTTDLCHDVQQSQKEAICNYLFSKQELTSKYGKRIYLNLKAVNTENSPCQSQSLYFEHERSYNTVAVVRNLFSCYGRHDPMRTQWDIDDAYNYFHVGVGSSMKEFYIFRQDKQFLKYDNQYDNQYDKLIEDLYIFKDRYVLVYGITNLNIQNLPAPNLEPGKLDDENSLLKQLSRNSAVEEIEINYYKNHERAFVEKTICDLKLEQKISVCEMIIPKTEIPSQTSPDTEMLSQNSINKEAFNEESAECVTKTLSFANIHNDNVNSNTVEMFPCHTKIDDSNETEIELYLSDGYRNKSVLVFIEYKPEEENIGDNSNSVKFLEFYENVPEEYSTKLVDAENENIYELDTVQEDEAFTMDLLNTIAQGVVFRSKEDSHSIERTLTGELIHYNTPDEDEGEEGENIEEDAETADENSSTPSSSDPPIDFADINEQLR